MLQPSLHTICMTEDDTLQALDNTTRIVGTFYCVNWGEWAVLMADLATREDFLLHNTILSDPP